MDNQVPTSWQTLLVFAVTTGVFSLLWSGVIDFVKSWWTRSTEAKYLAVRTAVALEAYAIECWHSLQMADGYYDQTREAVLEGLPPRPAIPADVDWRSIPPEIAAKVFSFVNDTVIEEREADYARSFEGNPFDYETATRKQGCAAWALAREIRRHFGLPLLDDQRKRLARLDDAR